MWTYDISWLHHSVPTTKHSKFIISVVHPTLTEVVQLNKVGSFWLVSSSRASSSWLVIWWSWGLSSTRLNILLSLSRVESSQVKLLRVSLWVRVFHLAFPYTSVVLTRNCSSVVFLAGALYTTPSNRNLTNQCCFYANSAVCTCMEGNSGSK
jgi:hypothetical protein